MAMTQTRPGNAGGAVSLTEGQPVTSNSSGLLADVLGTGNHRTIGRLFIGTSLVYAVAAGLAGAAVGAERLQVDDKLNVLDGDIFAQTLTFHSTAGVFLFLLPLVIGVALCVVPSQVGAATVAFPRAAATAYWAFLLGGGLVVASFLMNGGPYGGDGQGVDLFVVAMGVVVAALGLASVCLATTVLALRPTGLWLERVPFFAWSILVASVVWILSLGALAGMLILVYVDHRYLRFGIGKNTNLYIALRWFFGQPQIYSLAIPVLGLLGDTVSTFTGGRVRNRGILQGAIAAFGILSVGVYTAVAFWHPGLYQEWLFVGASVLVVLPLLVFGGGVVDALRRDRPRFAAPLLFAAAGYLLLLAGALTGVLVAIDALDLITETGTMTTAFTGQSHFVVGAAAVGALGAVQYWWPMALTRPLKAGLAGVTALVLLAGVAVLAIPDVISGFLDQPSLQGTGEVRDGVEALNGLSLLGGGLVILGVVLFVANLAGSLAGRRDPDVDLLDPWDGHTLEWSADPGAVTVGSATPLLDHKEAAR
jgi:heme/copper-type cytochrome/quinol oxidase subunit 1